MAEENHAGNAEKTDLRNQHGTAGRAGCELTSKRGKKVAPVAGGETSPPQHATFHFSPAGMRIRSKSAIRTRSISTDIFAPECAM